MKFRKSVVCHTAPSFGPWIGNNSDVLFNVTVFCTLNVPVEGKWICKKKSEKSEKPKADINPKIPDLSHNDRVSVQGVESLVSHFACLCREFDLYEVKNKK
jgi:hypothetical protein